jgi:transposase
MDEGRTSVRPERHKADLASYGDAGPTPWVKSMAARAIWIGLDVGADEMSVCATDSQGTVIFERSMPTSAVAFDELLRAEKRRIRLVGLESCSPAIPLTRSLRRKGYKVAVFDSRQASKFLAIRQNKTDTNDARGLAEIARVGRGSVSEVRVKSAECQRLRSMLVTRQRLVAMRKMVDGAMRALFRLNGGRLQGSLSAAVFRENVANEVMRVRKFAKIDLSEDIDPLLALSLALRSYIETSDKRLSTIVKNHPTCRNFLEIPGVGPVSALSFYTAVEDAARFQRSADIGPYLGMVPVVRQSGKSTTRRRISKMGDAMTRSYLTTAAVGHLRFGNSAISEWGQRLMERRSKRQAHIAVARKLAVVMIAMWKSGQPYDPHHSGGSFGELRSAA